MQEELEWLDSEGPISRTSSRGCAAHAVSSTRRAVQRALPPRLPRRARRGRTAVLVPTAERDPALGLGIFQPIFRGVRAIMYNSSEERAAIQRLSGNETRPGCRRRRRFGDSRRRSTSRAPGRSSGCRTRSSCTSAASTRTRAARNCSTSSSIPRRVRAATRPRPDRHAGAADPCTSAHPPSRLRRRPGQVRRDGGRRGAGHAVALREPVDGGARGVGARPAGARQRAVRRAGRPVRPQQCRVVL